MIMSLALLCDDNYQIKQTFTNHLWLSTQLKTYHTIKPKSIAGCQFFNKQELLLVLPFRDWGISFML